MSMLITVQTLVITVAILVVIYELKQCIHIKLQNFFLRQLSTFFYWNSRWIPVPSKLSFKS